MLFRSAAQTLHAVHNTDNTVTFRRLVVSVDVRLAGASIVNAVSEAKPNGHSTPTVSSAATPLMTLLDTVITTAATQECGVDNSGSGSLLVRNLTVSNQFGCAINNSWRNINVWNNSGYLKNSGRQGKNPPAGYLDEWTSSAPRALYGHQHQQGVGGATDSPPALVRPFFSIIVGLSSSCLSI